MTKLVGGAFDRPGPVTPSLVSAGRAGDGGAGDAPGTPPVETANVEPGDAEEFNRAWRRIGIRRAHRLELPAVAGRGAATDAGVRSGVETYRLVHEGRVVTQRYAGERAR